MLRLDTLLSEAGGIRHDKKTDAALEKLGLRTVGDLLAHYPRRHEDRSRFDAFPNGPLPEPVCLRGQITDTRSRFGRGRGSRWFEADLQPVEDENPLGDRIVLRWFNLAYIQKLIAVGHELIVYGQPKLSGSKLVIDHPDFEIVDDDGDASRAHLGRIVPIYPLVSGIGQKALRGLVHHVLERTSDDEIGEWLPGGSGEAGWTKARAVRTVHYPDSRDDLAPAKRHLALEEFVMLQLILQRRRADHRRAGGEAHAGDRTLLDRFLDELPFAPTAAQLRCIEEVRSDMASNAPMVRMLQGDVGAGKTLVAAAGALLAVEAGFDAALMAPTQILAEQHFRTFRQWFEPLGIEVVLKTGAREVGGDMPLFSNMGGGKFGSLHVGTHALIHDDTEFANGLGLAIIDEQHKFGVAQRERLVSRGDRPDVLAMTATPIPRTLALAFYGDLDVSVLDELPPGRGRIVTGIRTTKQTEAAAAFLRDQLDAGRQVYVVYPLIDESEKLKANAATTEFERWRKLLADVPMELLHGRMTPEEKDSAMERFRRGDARVLVSTTVIEVGVDVPNANTMLIYNAERFGLAQLHQLRGRIGRGEHKSYCVLMIDPEADGARERLAILEKTRDGFLIAEEDLRQRGPGEVLGLQQSGLPDMKFTEFLGDTELVEQAKRIAETMVAADSSPS